MTKVQKYLAEQRKLTREHRDKRARLGELAMQAERSDEEAAEVETNQLRCIEIDRRQIELDTAIGDEGGPETHTKPGTRGARGELATLFAYGGHAAKVLAFAGGKGRAPDGVTLDLQNAYGLPAAQLPAQLLLGQPVRGDDGVERFAVTAAPGDVGVDEAPAILPVPAGSVGDILSVERPLVASGDYLQPVLTTAGEVRGPFAASEAVDETDGTFSAITLAPQRGDVSFLGLSTDFARFASMQAALEQAIRDALTEWLDSQAVAAVESADVPRVDAAVADTYASYLKRLIYDNIDGRYASAEGDMRMLLGNDTLADMSSLYRAAAAGEESAATAIRRLAGAVRVTPLIAVAAAHKRDVLIRKGTRRALIQPVWQGIELIVDELTGRKKGEVTLSARVMSNKKVVDADAFARVQAQHQ